MRPNIGIIRIFLQWRLVVACSYGARRLFPSPRKDWSDQLKEKLSKTGVFFRADAPRSLRNPGDVYLPIFVEIINGVEQEAHTTGSSVSELCQTRAR